MKYRAEIDGLRALAVIPVILFHSGSELFSGGFVGVDVFFVISGYLITTILIEDIYNNSFSIINFYERRARRILPALFVMVLVTLLTGWFILTPYFYRDLFQTTFSVAFFASNILLYIKSGYFSAISELKPLLHTWSLAVEEQFYIIFPIFLLLLWRFGEKVVFWSIIFISIFSLLLSEWTWRNDVDANFYLLPTRIWELLVGSTAALILKKNQLKGNDIISFLGLLAIFYAIFLFGEETPFPSIYTLFPVLGTLLLILFASEETIIAKILNNKILVGVGLISYSLYLWHQPVFSFMRHVKLAQPNNYDFIYCFLIIFILAYVSWRFIEQPFRSKTKVNRLVIWIFSIFIFISLSSIGYFGHKNLGFPERLSLETQAISQGSFDKNPRQKECHFKEEYENLDKSCILGANVEPTFALVGDSHGDMFAHELHKKLASLNLASYNFSFNQCVPIHFKNNTIEHYSNTCYQKILNFLEFNNKLKNVIISFRWSTLITGKGYGVENLKLKEDHLDVNQDVMQKRAEIVSSKVEEISNLDKKIILIYPIPEAGEDVPNFITKQRMLYDKEFLYEIPFKDFMNRNRYSIYYFDKAELNENVKRIYPSKIFCDEIDNGFCKTVIDGRSLYSDDDHLSNFGASFIINSIFEN